MIEIVRNRKDKVIEIKCKDFVTHADYQKTLIPYLEEAIHQSTPFMQVHQEFESRLEEYDVTIAQWCILLTLYNENAASVTELSRFIEVDKASVSRVVDRLLSKGFVIHQPGADRRSGVVQLTLKARELIPQLILAAEKNEEEFFGCLTSDEEEHLRQLFYKIISNLPSIHICGWLSNTKEH